MLRLSSSSHAIQMTLSIVQLAFEEAVSAHIFAREDTHTFHCLIELHNDFFECEDTVAQHQDGDTSFHSLQPDGHGRL